MNRRPMLSTLLISICVSGCMTVGKNFPSDDLSWIVKNKTSRDEVNRTLGEPFRVGVDAGQLTWTFGYYRYKLFGTTQTKDLVVYFNRDKTVSNFTFNTGFPEEKQKWRDRTEP